jgi:hypothetical protein
MTKSIERVALLFLLRVLRVLRELRVSISIADRAGPVRIAKARAAAAPPP